MSRGYQQHRPCRSIEEVWASVLGYPLCFNTQFYVLLKSSVLFLRVTVLSNPAALRSPDDVRESFV